MTERLYYNNSFLLNFTAGVVEARRGDDGSTVVVLDRSAFYPTSGGQVFDTGWMELERDGRKLSVREVSEDEQGTILHTVETPDAEAMREGRVRGKNNVERRRDHMQQH